MLNISGNAVDYWMESGVEDNKNPLTVNWCGHQKLMTKNLARTRAHGRVDYQLIYLVDGKGYFEIDGRTREVQKGSIIVYPPHYPQYYSYYARDCTELYWIHFTGFSAGSCLENTGLLKHPVLQIGISEVFIELFEKIILELQSKKPNCTSMASAYFLQLLASMGRQLILSSNENSSAASNVIKRVLAKLHMKYNESFSVRSLAGECNLSLYRFIHKFKAETGMTPVEYITRIRINEARKLLTGSSLNIAEVSSIVGYENPLYFSRVFKKVTGISPSLYKKQGSG